MNSLLFAVAVFGFEPVAYAYVQGSVAAAPTEWDAQIRGSREFGLLGSQNIPESEIKEKASIMEYAYRLGTNMGTVAGIEDFSVHAFGSFFINGAESINNTATYGRDTGHLLGLEVAGNFVHEATRQVGWFLRYSVPVALNTEKFGKSRIDTLGIGIQSGFQISDRTQFELLTYYGSGYTVNKRRDQNAALVFSGLLGIRLPKSITSGILIKGGPFFESDVTERNDPIYGLVGFRGFRVGVTAIAAITLTERLGLEIGYIQKISGAYFRATKDVYSGLTMVF